jgi:galactokinase/mevalonate kinase-like predicted kinase
MIITRSPLRITLGGGGTDLPSYYRQHGGFLIAAAIDKHVYVTVTRPFSPGIYLKYSQLEHVDAIDAPRDSRCRTSGARDRCSNPVRTRRCGWGSSRPRLAPR